MTTTKLLDLFWIFCMGIVIIVYCLSIIGALGSIFYFIWNPSWLPIQIFISSILAFIIARILGNFISTK